MNEFADASGQRLNPAKTRLLVVGQQPPVVPAPSAALQVVESAKSLGVFFSNGPSQFDWDGRMAIVKQRMQRVSHIPQLSAGDSTWGLLLCDRPHLFPSAPADAPLPQPLKAMALGLRALPPMQHVGDVPLDIDMLCWNAPLWANPLFAVPQQWEWYGQARQVVVGLEYVVAPGLLNLPLLQSLGQAVLLLSELERVCSLRGLTAQRTAYEQQLWWQWFAARPQYADRQLAVMFSSCLHMCQRPGWQQLKHICVMHRQLAVHLWFCV
jgi:hypothetical protein